MAYLPKKRREAAAAWGLDLRTALRVKAVRCKKGACKMCPHSFFAYFRERTGHYPKEKYLGPCYQDGMPRVRYVDSA